MPPRDSADTTDRRLRASAWVAADPSAVGRIVSRLRQVFASRQWHDIDLAGNIAVLAAPVFVDEFAPPRDITNRTTPVGAQGDLLFDPAGSSAQRRPSL